MILSNESKASLPISLMVGCLAGIGVHSTMDGCNKNDTTTPARVSLDDNPFGQSTLPELPQDELLAEKFKSDTYGTRIGKSSHTSFTNEQLHQISEYIEQEKKRLIVNLLQSSTSINIYTTDAIMYAAGAVVKHPSGDCYILTNAHVFKDKQINSLDEIVVTDHLGGSLKPTKVISCNKFDIAIVKISDINRSVPIEKIGEPHLGDEVLGFGQPHGYESLYKGIISSVKAKYLTRSSDGKIILLEPYDVKDDFLMEHIQYSAPVDPGHSGGPVLNQDGQIIGISSAVCQDSRAISFLIPADLAISVGNQLFSNECYFTPNLDIEIQQLNDKQIEKLSKGCVVEEYQGRKFILTPKLSVASLGNDARKAGLQVDDIIIKINDDKIISNLTYLRALHKCQLDSEIKLTVLRGEKIIDLKLKTTPGQPIQTKVIE